MTNKEIARPLKETAALLELTGGNPFRARAFANAARTIERMDERLSDQDDVTEIQGIGKGLASQIAEILERGSFEVRDDLLGSIPPGIMDVLKVKGLGAKKARVLWKSLGIQTLDELEAAALAGRIAELDGFGARSQESILENIVLLRSYMGRRRLADAAPFLPYITSELEGYTTLVTGDARRHLNDVERLDLLVETDDGDIPGRLMWLMDAETGEDHGLQWVEGTIEGGMTVRLISCLPADAGRALAITTGPAPFAEKLARTSPADTEQDAFKKAGITWIDPGLRDLDGAVDRTDALASLHLVNVEDLHGCLHNHSTYSDGAHTLKEMADACRARGYSYLGICDHSQSLKVANGMDVKTVKRQQAEIKALNEAYTSDGGPEFRIFSGVESDILNDGSLDYDEEVLASFDFIVASVHTGFNMSEAAATKRLITAIRNPYTSILGHPTGRLILRREGYPIDHEAVLQACAAHGVAIELNANPWRLDLDWTWVERARQLGVPVSINPDAHAIDQIDLTAWGVRAARKGGLQPSECLNALSLAEFTAWVARS